MNKKNQGGFTLIELLTVIAIIGLLSSIVLVSVSSARGRARDAIRKSDLHQVQLAMELYFNQYGQYPKVATLEKNTVPAVAKSSEFSLINAAQAIIEFPCGNYPPGPSISCSKGVGSCSDFCYPGNGSNEQIREFFANFPKDPLNDTTHYYRFKAVNDQSFCFIIERLEGQSAALFATQKTVGTMTAGSTDCPSGSYPSGPY